MYLVELFFFFKQKTAYEMRISDWSSDVCSSDLDTDEEMRTDEEGRLPRLDRIAVEIGGARDDEQLVAIGFDLGELVRLQRILDRERMQAEAPGDAGKLGRGRLVAAEPEEIAIVAILRDRLVRSQVTDEFTGMVDAGGHDRQRRSDE